MAEHIFLAPRAKETTYDNLKSTVINGRDYSELAHLLDEEGKKALSHGGKLYAWGNVENLKTRWDRMQPNDLILFYARGEFVYAGRCLYKQLSSQLSDALWPRSPRFNKPWSCVFFLTDIKLIKIPLSVINEIGKYNFRAVMGFQSVNNACVESIIQKYGSTENFVNNYSPQGDTAVSRKKAVWNKKRAEENAKDATFQQEIEYAPPIKLPPGRIKPPSPKLRKGSVAYQRKAGVARARLEEAKYKCEVDPNHVTFISRATGKPYVEAHHLVPVGRQGEFPDADLDVPENILILCPLCHRKFHHAIYEPQVELIERFLSIKKELLKGRGIEVSSETLSKYYSEDL